MSKKAVGDTFSRSVNTREILHVFSLNYKARGITVPTKYCSRMKIVPYAASLQ